LGAGRSVLWIEEAAAAVTPLKPRLIRDRYRPRLAQDPLPANPGDYGTGVVIRDARTAAAWRARREELSRDVTLCDSHSTPQRLKNPRVICPFPDVRDCLQRVGTCQFQ
jgi:hypothetical protein